MNQLTSNTQKNTLQLGKMKLVLPTLIIDAGKPTAKRFIEFFTANIRNPNTREACGRAVRDFFAWCDEDAVGPLIDIEAIHIAAYIEVAELEVGPLFRTLRGRSGELNDKRLHRTECLAMIKRRCRGHSDPKTTLLYDRRSDEISLDEVEKIGI